MPRGQPRQPETFGSRVAKNLAEFLARSLGRKGAQSAVLQEAIRQLRGQIDPSLVDGALTWLGGIAAPAALQALGVEEVFNRLGLPGAALAQEISDEGLDEAIAEFFFRLRETSTKPKDEQDAALRLANSVANEKGRAVTDAVNGIPVLMVAGRLSDKLPDPTASYRMRWQGFLASLTGDEQKELDRRRPMISVGEVRMTFESLADEDQARARLKRMLGFEEKKAASKGPLDSIVTALKGLTKPPDAATAQANQLVFARLVVAQELVTRRVTLLPPEAETVANTVVEIMGGCAVTGTAAFNMLWHLLARDPSFNTRVSLPDIINRARAMRVPMQETALVMAYNDLITGTP